LMARIDAYAAVIEVSLMRIFKRLPDLNFNL
jgi:hypothetical protein